MKVDSTVVQCLHYLTVDHKLRGSDRGNKENNGSPRDQSFGEPLCSGTRCHKTGPPFVRHWGQKKTLRSGTRCHKTGPPFVRHWGQKNQNRFGRGTDASNQFFVTELGWFSHLRLYIFLRFKVLQTWILCHGYELHAGFFLSSFVTRVGAFWSSSVRDKCWYVTVRRVPAHSILYTNSTAFVTISSTFRTRWHWKQEWSRASL